MCLGLKVRRHIPNRALTPTMKGGLDSMKNRIDRSEDNVSFLAPRFGSGSEIKVKTLKKSSNNESLYRQMYHEDSP